jgi:hypothetical protein
MIYGLGLMAFGVLKVLAGLFLLWGQFEYQEPGTVYGFLWPRNIHEFFADLRTINLLFLAVWLIRTGMGEWSPRTKADKSEV